MKRNKNIDDEIATPEERALIKKMFDIYMEYEFAKCDESIDYEFSDNFKRKMNKLFREVVGTDKIPHPEIEEKD